MVSKKKAAIASLGSALLVGLVHYFAHSQGLEPKVVGYIVMVAVFLVAYFGMNPD